MKTLAIVFLTLFLICSGFVGLSVYFLNKMDREDAEKWKQYCHQQLDEQITEIKAGKRHFISFYESCDTDSLMKKAANVAEIQGITLQGTDVSDQGIQYLSALPNLKGLVIYRGNITDQGLACITKIKSLESLILISTDISDQSLGGLVELPNLQSLILAPPNVPRARLTDAGLTRLQELTKLKKLNLCGGWASAGAVADLQKALPDCDITTNIGYSL